MCTKEEKEGILWEFHQSGLGIGEACGTLRMFPSRNLLPVWLRQEASGELVAREMPDRLVCLIASELRVGGGTAFPYLLA